MAGTPIYASIKTVHLDAIPFRTGELSNLYRGCGSVTPHILLTAVVFGVFWQALLRARPCRGQGGGEDYFLHRTPPGARRPDHENSYGGDREHSELLPGMIWYGVSSTPCHGSGSLNIFC